jgi:hypothetical protein
MSGNEIAATNVFKADPAQWYAGQYDHYASFTRLLHATIENLMRASAIDYLSVTHDGEPTLASRVPLYQDHPISCKRRRTWSG